MKRTLSMVIYLLLVMSLVACGSPSTGDVQKPTDVSANYTDSSTTQEIEQKNETNQKEQETTITETVLVDEAGIKITAKSLNTDTIFGPEVKLLIENNSGEDLTFQSRNSSVNGYMVDTMMSVDVVDGKKANDSITFSESDLKACGISTIADIEFSFHIFTTADWEDYLNTPQIQLKTSAADTYEYSFDDNGKIAYEGNGIKIVVKGLSEDDSLFGPELVVFIENNSEKDITVQAREVSINGFMVSEMFSCEVMAGKHAVDTISFMSSELEENEIEKIEEIELSFHLFDSDKWETIVDTDTISIAF